MHLRHVSILLFAFAAAGCSAPKPPPADQPPDPQAAAQKERDQQLLHAIQRPIDKAKGVEDTTLKAADEQRQQIDEETGG